MKSAYKHLLQFFTDSTKADLAPFESKSFFDYSSGEKIKILRAAGRQAQEEQQQILRTYEARFGRTIS